jgi:hypothetical protein
MKIRRLVDGKYSEIRLEDGRKVFLSVLPDRITASTMTLSIPTRKIWEFIFPFYIRTALEPWETSESILKIVLHTIEDTTDIHSLKHVLETETSKTLREYVQQHGEKARYISVDKIGAPAFRQMLSEDLLQIETIIHQYGKVVGKVGQEAMEKYPAGVYPQSLLPYSKEVIQRALEDGLRYIEEERMRESIGVCLAILVAFVEDEDANKRNSDMLSFMKHRGKGVNS